MCVLSILLPLPCFLTHTHSLLGGDGEGERHKALPGDPLMEQIHWLGCTSNSSGNTCY